jgi:hypothetical protein
VGRVKKTDSISQLKRDLELRLQKHFEDMLRAEIRWNHAFGVTFRYNGSIVVGNPRDTIDTRNSFKKLRVDITGTVNLKISIKFLDDNAQYIFGEGRHRYEYFDYALEKLPAYITKLIVEMGIEARLGSKSKAVVRQFQKAKIKRKSRKK